MLYVLLLVVLGDVSDCVWWDSVGGGGNREFVLELAELLGGRGKSDAAVVDVEEDEEDEEDEEEVVEESSVLIPSQLFCTALLFFNDDLVFSRDTSSGCK